VPDTNPHKVREIKAIGAVGDAIARARQLRDQTYEFWFEAIYGR
jgi:hypothetical protein